MQRRSGSFGGVGIVGKGDERPAPPLEEAMAAVVIAVAAAVGDEVFMAERYFFLFLVAYYLSRSPPSCPNRRNNPKAKMEGLWHTQKQNKTVDETSSSSKKKIFGFCFGAFPHTTGGGPPEITHTHTQEETHTHNDVLMPETKTRDQEEKKTTSSPLEGK